MPVVRIALAAALVGCAPVHAQWLNYPTPGVPRLPNGKLNLNAPAPRTADGKLDLSGLWEPVGPANSSFVGNSARDPQFADVGKDVKGGLPLQPWAADLLKTRLAANSKDDPDSRCLPLGPIKMHLHPYPRRIIQTPDLMVILFERDTAYRQIFTDSRALLQDPQPSFNGYSTGKWEGDTLVVQTNGIKDGAWLDVRGTPLTDAAKITERFRRPNFGMLEIQALVDDPKAYTKPWAVNFKLHIVLDTELIDEVCLEGERSVEHIPVR